MKKGEIYKLPHKCFIGQWSTPDDGGHEIFGRHPFNPESRFDSVVECDGWRCIALVERVRDHWVVDTWLETGDGSTRDKTSLLGHKYLSGLIKGLNPCGELQ